MSISDKPESATGNMNGDLGKDKLSKVTRSAEHLIDEGRERLRTAVDTGKMGMDEAQRFVTQQMHERPLTSAATAMGIGLVLGMLISSRR